MPGLEERVFKIRTAWLVRVRVHVNVLVAVDVNVLVAVDVNVLAVLACAGATSPIHR